MPRELEEFLKLFITILINSTVLVAHTPGILGNDGV
jgi:hypothetical protein